MVAVRNIKNAMESEKVSVGVELLSVDDLPAAQEFYNSVGYKSGIAPGCDIAAARIGGEIVGLSMICHENEMLVLRGMQVDPTFQRQGIGRQILERTKELLSDRECWAIPYDHLENFYGTVGFVRVDEEEAPEFLKERIGGYRQIRPDKEFVIMKCHGA